MTTIRTTQAARALAEAFAGPGPTDGELLGAFVESRDLAAFGELVRRHGPMVLGVCLRALRHRQDAEDAFQAAFLVLARKAGSISPRNAVGNWLHGVALKTAHRARATVAKRRGREVLVPALPETAIREIGWDDVAAVLDEELDRLPNHYRAVILLCDVEGRTRASAAQHLGCPEGSVSSRLSRARAVLARRLTSRGVTLSAGAVGLLVAGNAAPAGVSARLVRATTETVAAPGNDLSPTVATLTEEVLKTMTGTKLKAAALALALLGLIGLAGAVGSEQPGDRERDKPSSTPVGVADRNAPLPATPPVLLTKQRADEPVRTPKNFVVHAPTPVMARVIASEAEHHRRVLAVKWFGRELPQSAQPCAIRFTPGRPNGGTSTFVFGKNSAGEPALSSAEMNLRGDFMDVLTSTLPHEVTHTVLASHFGKPLPRWADEGLSLLSESDEDQFNHDVRVRELLNAGRGMRLKVLLRLTEYPKDMMVLYAQGHSLARFLATRPKAGFPVLKDVPYIGKLFEAPGADGYRRLIAFVQLGTDGNTAESWAKAAEAVYGFKSVEELEEAWLTWLKTLESNLKAPPKSAPSRPVPPIEGELIPPTALPAKP